MAVPEHSDVFLIADRSDDDHEGDFYESSADSFNEYLQAHPHPAILSVRFDHSKHCFMFLHKKDGEFAMSIADFFDSQQINIILIKMMELLDAV